MATRFTLSSHAQKVMVERGIREEWLTLALLAPERTEPDKRRADRRCALRRIPEFGQRWLRVVYAEHSEGVRVITVFFDRGVRSSHETLL